MRVGNKILEEYLIGKKFTHTPGGFGNKSEKKDILKASEGAATAFSYEYTPDIFHKGNHVIFFSEITNHITIKDVDTMIFEGDYEESTLLIIKDLLRKDSLDNLLD